MTSLDRWVGKVAVVTGASAGIGAAIALALADRGMKVLGLARRAERVQELKNSVKGSGELHALACDVSKEADIEAAFQFVRSKFGAVHVLVNNAGIVRPGLVSSQDPKLLREILDVNVMGLTLCTQQAVKLMKETGVNDGHIIHINSVAGHQVISFGETPIASMYSASKFAVTALTETLRQELRFLKLQTRVTSISPGYVTTEIMQAAVVGLGAAGEQFLSHAADSFADVPALEAVDIADAVVYVLSTPPRVQIHELTIKPVGEPF